PPNESKVSDRAVSALPDVLSDAVAPQSDSASASKNSLSEERHDDHVPKLPEDVNGELLSVDPVGTDELIHDRKEEIVEFKDTNASNETQTALQQLLGRYDGLWRGERRGCAAVMSHRITTTSDRPIVTRPRSFTPAQQRVLQEELQVMKAAGVIEPSNSPHASEVVLVKKKTGGWRVCIDYRNVNDVTVPDQYPLPRIADLVFRHHA
ncbi:MAG: hypothetical protein KVP17_005334, partial [Porospora cf. gigantea B]|uniref:uncharacterized protein n=1 Tax=Porospora cf. gigantea B TaxID=2853592 RepID=UPI003571E5EF